MESIFTSKELYDYVNTKLQTDISLSQKLSILFKSIQKDFTVDKFMAVIFLNYIKCLNLLESDDILLIFKTSKMKYFKFFCFWREYINQLVKFNSNMEKILNEGIKFLNVKEFDGKLEIIEFLQIVKESEDKTKFIFEWENEWMKIEDICDNNLLLYKIKNKKYDNSNEKNKINNLSLKIKNDNFGNEKENFKNDGNDKNIYNFNYIEKKLNESNENSLLEKNVNININFDDFSYSPLLKKKFFLNTPSTGNNNKYSFKSPDNIIYKSSENIKCKIEDVSLKDDTRLNLKKDIDENKKQLEYFKLKEKQLQKIEILGKGGSSKVYKVLYKEEFYALKIINIDLDATLKDLLLQEIDYLIKLKDVNGIIKMIDYDVLPENIYILLEYGESDLLKFIKSDIKFNLIRVKYIWQEILLICKNIHEKRIIHGDLKPANFVFVKNKLKIIDFGISKSLKGDTTNLNLNTICGTINYCAPELVNDYTKRRSSDVWSLGIILHEMWYGKNPLDPFKTYAEKKENINNIRKNIVIKNEVDVVIYKCLNEDCKKRPTVNDLLNDEFITGIK